ncbi:uncharacterized protein LOC125472524 [Pyrus x bretschneideri]|uniref:uncharacterized protein LOC125472524 n=1 Tax=Pyrus x bretschneideri TaxID=225117 RepID=UPI0020306AF7|nr:uncharacterized protein LOC125472524 [Pyrus x bretschneideri]
MLLSASVNSISSIPSPVYQCKKAFRLNIAVVAIFRPLGGMSHTLDLTLLGIHSTKYEEFLFWTLIICSSTSLVLILARNMADTVR